MTCDENNTRSSSPNAPSEDADGRDLGPEPAAKPAVDQAAFIRRAVGELTPKQRFVVECRHGFRGCRPYRFQEIAALMGVHHSNVVRLYQRAIKQIWLNHAGIAQAPTSRGVRQSFAVAASPEKAKNPSGGEEPGVCLSPFVPEHHGVTPGRLPGGLWEWWLEQEAWRGPDGD